MKVKGPKNELHGSLDWYECRPYGNIIMQCFPAGGLQTGPGPQLSLWLFVVSSVK
jgi:hypothetical protein